MRIGAFNIHEPVPELRQPHALVVLQPWIDAGSAGTLALSWLERYTRSQRLGELATPGNFLDFTRYRPTLYLERGIRRIAIPNSYVYYGKRESGNDFLFIHHMEPTAFGEMYAKSVVKLLVKFGVTRYCTIGSMYDVVPHTRPLLVSGGATGKAAEQEFKSTGATRSNYQGPTTITFLISQQAQEMGIETLSLLAHLPQYTHLDEDYIGALRLVRIISSLYNIPVDTFIMEKAEMQRKEIAEAVADNPEVIDLIKQLEATYDTRESRGPEVQNLSPDVENFLREMEGRLKGDSQQT